MRGCCARRWVRCVLSVGAVGEFGPIVAVAILLTNRDAGVDVFLLLALFVAVAVVAALLAMQVHPPRFVALMRRHLHSTSQLPVRISVLLVILLVDLAVKLSLDVLLGAFAAGVVVRLFITGRRRAADHEQARGHRLRVPHPDLLHRERHHLRPARPDPPAQGAAARPLVHRAVPGDARPSHLGLLPRRPVQGGGRAPWPCSPPPGCRSSWSSPHSASTSTGCDRRTRLPWSPPGMLSVLLYPLIGLDRLSRAHKPAGIPQPPWGRRPVSSDRSWSGG